MKLIKHLEDVSADLRGGALAIGNFDGVHRGHLDLVRCLVRRAHQLNRAAVVFTFEPHPATLLRPEAVPPPLTWLEQKVARLADQQVDAVVAYPTDMQLLELSPTTFFRRIVVETFAAQAMIEGPNFFFGKDRAGDIACLKDLCRQFELQLEIVEPVMDDGQPISSSRIRRLIQEGAMRRVASMLGRPYRIRGSVARGAQRGRTLGFPTANLVDIDTLVPGPGVYAGQIQVGTSVWPAAINIGANPTFGETKAKLEAHLIGFQDTLYDQRLEVDFLARLRDIHTFASADALKQQLHADVEATVREFGDGQHRSA